MTGGYLADKGHRILRNGFNVIPIRPGDKAPSVKDWRGKPTTKTDLDKWVSNGRAKHGVGITTDNNPLVDIDIFHPGMNRYMVNHVETHIGFAPIRVGYAPKCGLLFRSSEPFRKITSKEYVDPDGRKAQIEILGIGQQFVAYHIHPDTHQPYRWLDAKDNPEVTHARDLPVLTQEQGRAIVAEFERKADKLGWKTNARTSSSRMSAPAPDIEDPFDIGRDPLGLTDDELRQHMMLIPNDNAPYEGEGLSWFNVVAAIHHESGGSDEGYNIAYVWSDQSGKHTNERFDKTWGSFTSGEKPHPVTARLLLKLSKEFRAASIAESLANAKTKQDLEAVALVISKIEKLNNLEREEYAVAVKEAATRILGHSLSIKIAREMIRPPVPADLSGFQLNEDGVALAFAEKHKDALRFCATTGMWHQWDGIYWKPQKTRLAFHWARLMCRELRADNPTAEALGKAGAAEAVEKFCRADPRLVVESTVFDTDPWLLGTPDGTIDLHTGELRDARQEDYITKLTGIGPGLGAGCPRWMKFLNEVTKNDLNLIRYLQMQCGYYLTGSTREQSLLFIHGPGGNGKGVFIHILEYIFGDYSTTASMDTFADNHGFHRHPADVAALNGYRLVITSEVAEGQVWDEVRIKALTGGDRISARLMRENFSNFVPNFKLMVIGNNEPALRTVDDAMKRRLQMALFDFKPPIKNLDLESELKSEAPDILLWMIDGALDYHKNGMIIPETVREETDRYFSEQDSLGQWLDGFTEKGDFETATTELKASYDLISGSEGFRSKRSMMAFSASLAKRGYERTRNITDANGIRGRGFKGLRLKEVFDDL